MRIVLSSGFLGPQLSIDSQGVLTRISPGTDSYYEHKYPHHYLVPNLCVPATLENGLPDYKGELLESRRIVFSEGFQFLRCPIQHDAEPQAIFGYHASASFGDSSVLREFKYCTKAVSAALAYGNFAIKVTGEEEIRALQSFYDATHRGQVTFVNALMGHAAVSLVLVRLDTLPADEMRKIAGDQLEWARHQR